MRAAAALNHACVLSHSRVEDTIAGLCSASLIVQSQARDKLPFRKRLAVPCLACSGFAPFAAHPSPSCALSCSFVLAHSPPLPSQQLPHPLSLPFPEDSINTCLHPPSTVHQSTVAGRHSFLSALLFSSSTCAGLSASRYCRCWRHRHPPSAQRQFTRE
jgi:hypothetical protein